MHWRDLTASSFRSIARNRSRSVLTILGIVIGIASVILMLSIGRGAETFILNQVADLGSDLIFVEPASGDPAAGPPNPFIEQTITLDDLEALEDSGLFSSVAGVLISTMTTSRDEVSEFAQIAGVVPDYIEVLPATLNSGRHLDDIDIDSNARVAILGSEIADTLFGDQDPLGEKVEIKNTNFRVIGVYNEQGSRFFQNLDNRIYVPVTVMQKELLGVDYVNFIAGRAIGEIEFVKEETRWIMRDEHDIENPEGEIDKDDFFVSSQSDAVEIVGAVGGVLSILLASIAAISLLVGGIGIMNIMLVSVTERIKEIGLRKAVGATRKDILRQFMAEAVLLTFLGGLVGVVFGVLFSYLAALGIIYTVGERWEFIVPPQAVVLAVVVSVVVGVVFGVYPARRAARLDPITALRYE